MRGRGIGVGALLLALLVVAPPGLSVTGSGDVVARLPIQLWGPLEADASSGLAAGGGLFEAGLVLAKGRATLTTLELPLGPLAGPVRRTTELVGGTGSAFHFDPAPDAQLLAWGAAHLATEGPARLDRPTGPAFALDLGDAGRIEAFPSGVAAVEATAGVGTLEGPLRVLFAGAPAQVRRGAALDALELAPPRPSESPPALLGRADLPAALPGAAAPAAAPELPELPVALDDVLVVRLLEIEGEGRLAVRSHGATLRAFGAAPSVHVLGAAMLPGALGDFGLGDRVLALRGDRVQAAGDFRLRALPGPGDERRVQMEGTFDSFAVNGALVPVGPSAGGPAVLAAAAALALAAPLLKPFLARLLAPLYARIPTSEILGSTARRKLFEMVQHEPGLSLSEIAQRAGLSWGATVHHLAVLRRGGLVVSMRHGRYRRWFANGAFEAERRGQVAALRNEVSARVAKLVLDQPGLSQKQIADRAGMSPQAVHWHLVRLADAGLVERVRDGREVRHFVRQAPPALAPSLSVAAAPAPVLPQPARL